LPSINGLIYTQYSRNDLEMVTFNNDASVFDLQTYRASVGIHNPYVRDTDGSLFSVYEVLVPPSYFILDQQGIVRYRTDDIPNFDADAIKTKVDELVGL